MLRKHYEDTLKRSGRACIEVESNAQKVTVGEPCFFSNEKIRVVSKLVKVQGFVPQLKIMSEICGQSKEILLGILLHRHWRHMQVNVVNHH